jgi:hypothetical protein
MAAKASKQRRGVDNATAQRLNVRIGAAAYQRLMVHALMSGKNPGKLVEELVEAGCRDWRIQALSGAPVRVTDRLDLGAEINSPAPILA